MDLVAIVGILLYQESYFSSLISVMSVFHSHCTRLFDNIDIYRYIVIDIFVIFFTRNYLQRKKLNESYKILVEKCRGLIAYSLWVMYFILVILFLNILVQVLIFLFLFREMWLIRYISRAGENMVGFYFLILETDLANVMLYYFMLLFVK